MLFDLQSRGRRSIVKVIYIGLAILMGGGLILFGIGTGTGGGGLFDAFSGGGSSTSAQFSSAEQRANRAVKLHPQDPRAWAALAFARYQTAGAGENYDQATNGFTGKGRAKLATVSSAWHRYLALNPKHPDVGLARQMANAYSETGLNDPAEAATAMEIVTEDEPTYAGYAALANYAYFADQVRKGDLASAKAVGLAPSAQRRLVRSQLLLIKRQALRQAAEDAVRRATGAAPAAPAAPQTGRRGVG